MEKNANVTIYVNRKKTFLQPLKESKESFVKKKLVDSGFVKICDELVIGMQSLIVKMQKGRTCLT